uniref:Annexin n=1 Tax=Podarcis muralis TaxID=64176 RepID=A0A670IG44_PODMU
MSSSGKAGRYRGSVKDYPDFDANQDAEALYNAMKGFGSDKEAILELITSRSNKQRHEICQAYKALYGKDLIADLKYELTGKFERLIVGLMRPLEYFDAKEIKDALKGIGTDEKCLIEILASRTNQQIRALVEAYKDAYERDLEEDVVADTSGHFKKMLVVLLQGTREDDDVVSEDLVQQDAQVVAETLKLSDVSGDDSTSLETRFMTVLCTQSYPQLRRVFQEFVKMTNHDVAHAINKRMSGDVRDVFLAIVRSVKNKQAFFADKLYKSMKGAGTDDRTLIRIIVSRSEIDLLNIRREFWDIYDKSLYHMIEKDTSGDYCKALLAICGEEK